MAVTFSIVIPTYNRADLLPRAIESALAQSEVDLEVVVVDDGSSDDTAAVVRAFADPRVRYLDQPNAGVSAARNAGAGAARGEHLIFLDSDDELLPGAVAHFRDAAAANGWSVVLSGWIRVAPDRREWRTLLPKRVGREEHLLGPYLPGAFMITKALFAATGEYDEHLRFSENTVLGWRIREVLVAAGEHIGIVEVPLVARYSQPDRAYDRARYEASVRILEHYSDALDTRVTGDAEPSKRRSNFLAVAGANAVALGHRREGWRYSLAALRSDPRSFSRYRGLLGLVRTSLHRARSEPRAVAPVPRRTRDAADPGRGSAAGGAIHHLTVTSDGWERGSGPAAQLATGIPDALDGASDDDWIFVGVGDNAAGSAESLRDFATWLRERGAPVGAVGFGGAHFDRRRGRLRELTPEERAGPATVDELGSGGSFLLRAAAAREVGGFDAELGIGFTALEYGLRLASHGYGLYVIGPPWSAPADSGSGAARHGAPEPWLRYYEVRNLVVVTRRFGSTARALRVSARALLAPGVDVVRRPWRALQLTIASGRGCRDAWRGRLGSPTTTGPARAATGPADVQNW